AGGRDRRRDRAAHGVPAAGAGYRALLRRPAPPRAGRGERGGGSRLPPGVLAGRPRVIWPERHQEERISFSTITRDDIGIRLPDDNDDAEARNEEPPGPPSPLWTAVPPLLWPVLVQLLAVAVVFAL